MCVFCSTGTSINILSNTQTNCPLEIPPNMSEFIEELFEGNGNPRRELL